MSTTETLPGIGSWEGSFPYVLANTSRRGVLGLSAPHAGASQHPQRGTTFPQPDLMSPLKFMASHHLCAQSPNPVVIHASSASLTACLRPCNPVYF